MTIHTNSRKYKQKQVALRVSAQVVESFGLLELQKKHQLPK